VLEVEDVHLGIFDVKRRAVVPLPKRSPPNEGAPEHLLRWEDDVSFFRNWQQLPLSAKAKAFAVGLLVGMVLGGIPGGIGVWLWASGDGPNALAIGLALGLLFFVFGLWFGMHRGLSRYIEVTASRLPRVEPGRPVRLDTLIGGHTHVALDRWRLRVVAANVACGQRKERKGDHWKTVSFRRAFGPQVLFDRQMPALGPGQALRPTLAQFAFSLDEAYRSLSPRMMTSDSHGIDVALYVHVIVPDLTDLSLRVGLQDAGHDLFRGWG
jgi:hypothetical protein